MKDQVIVDTVDGRNRAPVDMVNIPLSLGLYTSQVVQDLFHQQYYLKYIIWKRGIGYEIVVVKQVRYEDIFSYVDV